MRRHRTGPGLVGFCLGLLLLGCGPEGGTSPGAAVRPGAATPPGSGGPALGGPALGGPALDGPAMGALPAADCGMRLAFHAPDADSPGGRAQVWGPAADPSRGPAFFAERLNVNTDGTRRSYSVDDPGGSDFALNRICNAMTNYCRELDAAGRRARFATLREARDRDWPADLLRATRLSAMVIPRQPDGRVCPELASEGRRYLVSSTALFDPAVRDECRIERYLDALTVPALVLPGRQGGAPTAFEARGIRPGDVLVAWRAGMARPVFAVAGDTGPNDKLGEGSIALNAALLGRTDEPRNYDDLVPGFVVPRAHVLIFPATRQRPPLITRERIGAAAGEAFRAWGGGSEAGAIARLQACAKAYDAATTGP